MKRGLSALLVLIVLVAAGFLWLRESSGSHTLPAAAAEPPAPPTSVPSATVTTGPSPVTTIAASTTGTAGVTSTVTTRTATTTTIATTTTSTMLGSIPAGAPALVVPILMYHYVDASPPPVGPYADGLTVRTPDFGSEMALLESGGYHTVTFAQVWQAMAGQAALPSKPVLLTFDDGGLDNFTVAFPILKRHGFVATFFVITNAVGHNPQSMTWDQLREMKAAGMTIGSHTKGHPDLRTVSPDRLWDELAGSRAAIEAELGAAPDVLSYPSGKFSAKIAKLASTAGYRMAVTTRWGKTIRPASMLELPRMRVPARLSVAAFQLELE